MATHADWLALVRLDGLVISEPVLEEHFPEGPTPVTRGMHNWFRRRAERYHVAMAHTDPEKRAHGAREWISFLLGPLLEYTGNEWLKAHAVPKDLSVYLDQFEQELKPSRVLKNDSGPVLLVSIVPPDQSLDRRDKQAGRWKASPTTKLDRLLRETGNPLGLVTNGDQFRLVYSPTGLNSGHITWSSRLLTEEKATLDAFFTLLGLDSLLPTAPDALTLADLCRISQDRQVEVADQLGVQVRDGLERLIWAWDDADRAADGKLLADMTEDQIYEMGLAMMMRLVFLLYAEERSLLPHGEVLYDQGYGLTYLWHRLQRQHREDPTRMNHTYDAWDRFLGTCRLVHGGCRHPDLSLLAYGGSLFDPTRFPVLESPDCRISNRTFYNTLHLLLFARQRKGAEPQRVGYWSIDVEQIGYIYEGLLDHRCARAGDVPVVKFKGAGEKAQPITDLEKLSPEELVNFVVSETGKKKETVQDILNRSEPDPKDIEQLQGFPPPVVERVRPFAGFIQCNEVVPPRWRYLTTGTSRRASGAHYTPQSLTERIVRVTLEPLVYRNVEGKPGLLVEPKEVKSPRELLDLKICDIAMGSGAFLVQAVRYLGDRLVEAWDRAIASAQTADSNSVLTMPFAEPVVGGAGTDTRAIDPEKRVEMILWARRYVVERCIYGVDVNPLAVEMAKLSLWLTTLAKDRPFTFLDHALRCGDSLVGVDQQQLLTWSLDRSGSGLPILEPIVRDAVDQAIAARRELEQISVVEAADQARKSVLLERAEAALERVRLAGDLILCPSFSEEKPKDRSATSDRLLTRYSLANNADLDALRHDVSQMLDGQRTFHWPFEFAEVFLGGDRRGFDAIVGNPPFVGGRRMRSTLGDEFVRYLLDQFSGASLNADLCSFFFLRAFKNLRDSGNLGLIATNTIGQGDTRETGLDRIVSDGGSIYAAVSRMPWPGHAAVNVSVVHLSRGLWAGRLSLDSNEVPSISASLDAGGVSGKQERLVQNRDRSFIGSFVNGIGFVVSPEEASVLIAKDPRNEEVLFPYLSGKDLNTSPDQSATRWIINFHDWPLERAELFPECMTILRELVFPHRQKVKRKNYRKYWWQFAERVPGLYSAVTSMERVLVCPIVTKYLSFVFVPNNQVFMHKLCVFSLAAFSDFAVLQSHIHEGWARFYSSTLDTRLNYSPTDCFGTFPFPRKVIERQDQGLNRIGEGYHNHRQKLMLANGEGLTRTYNRFHDPACKDPRIQSLRDLHIEMDNAVRDAYGWSDLDMEHAWVKTTESKEKKDHKTGKISTVEKVDWRFTISETARQEIRVLPVSVLRSEPA